MGFDGRVRISGRMLLLLLLVRLNITLSIALVSVLLECISFFRVDVAFVGVVDVTSRLCSMATLF